MADVLSQSEIDALLNSMFSGGDEPTAEAPAEEPEKKYRKYDFASPKKFTKDRIKMLQGIFDNYARIVNSRLNARLRATCEIVVETIEEQRYYEFSNALTEGDVLSLISVETKDKKEEIPVMFYMSTSTSLIIMDYLLGGNGAPVNVPQDYSYTEVELRLYEDTVMDMVSVMGKSWESYIPVNFTYDRTETNPTLNQVIDLDEVIVIVDAKVQFPNGDGRISICLPSEILLNLFTEINKENPARRSTLDDNSDEIFEHLKDSELEVVAELGSTELSLRDVYHLHVGDVIDLGQAHTSPIYLGIGGYHWFTGKIGTHKKNMAVQIDEVCYAAEQRSE